MDKQKGSVAELVRRIKDGTVTEEEFQNFGNGLVNRAVEEALRTIPQVVDHVTKQTIFIRQKAAKFYDKHPELAEDKEMVAKTLEVVESENPGLSYDEVIERVPERLEKLKDQVRRNKPGVSRPSLKEINEQLGDL